MFQATKYKCRAGNNQCDVSLANRRSCQACRYKKCVASGMKPGLVLSDDQCNKKFGHRRIMKEDKLKSSLKSKRDTEEDEDADDPEEMDFEATDEMADEDYSVLIDPSKSLIEQNHYGRQLFISIFSTGSVNSGLISDKEIETFSSINNHNSIATSFIIERAVHNSRKFLSFSQGDRRFLSSNGLIKIGDVTHTLVEQTVLVLKQVNDFKNLSCKDQTELLESNSIIVTLLMILELYNADQKAIVWNLTEQDYQHLRQQNFKIVNSRTVIDHDSLVSNVDTDLREDFGKIFRFFDYFSSLGLPRNALFVLSIVVTFCHDCCDIENKEGIENIRRRYLIILYECIQQTEGVLGACKIALKLHNAIHHLNRICQLFSQKFVTVND